MERDEFLKNLAITATSIPLLLSACKATSSGNQQPAVTDCGANVTPPVPEGPFYIDEQLNRSNIAEDRTGIPLTLLFTVEDVHCKPIPNAIVDIWHCDKEGKYSDEAAENTVGQKWLRGYQATDANGRCSFQTIFPGWYNRRLTHIHGKVKVGNVTKQTTNFFIPKTVEEAAYATPLYGKGKNPVTLDEDIELRGDKKSYEALTMSVTGNVASGFIASFTVVFV
ncbi:dioxygenase family protein [Foetidibacter luteolus]|uniref:dioxygenase family protein n=1 Tax=Foetidibacter luteolus TaxID=2608880 RepID=UPI001A9A1D88|nr:hypothetical protein [Foetidibacter luteolus]